MDFGRTLGVGVVTLVLLCVSCEPNPDTDETTTTEGTEAQAPAEEPMPPQEQALPEQDVTFEEGESRLEGDCETKRGTVTLTAVGNPGDGFQVTLTCDGQAVAQCAATIPAGAGQASCSDGPPDNVPPGVARCVLSPQNGNTPAATARTWGCG